jgi:RHH-type proline utilization regulon transcriptional repressor/proline dehydrogenase/delta 1-pyrroline-5-carboxylate dehydrogenase
MEQVEASLHGWEQTPYTHKSETDANYKRMVVYGCEPAHARAVNLGIASHNLFDIAYALLIRTERELEKEISFEMLEGMADHIRRTVQALSKDMLLYCPIATKEDFQSAIAYLIRRLDENTGPENFLRHSFGLRPGTKDWEEQVALFKKACAEMKTTSAHGRRTQDRMQPPHHLPFDAPFALEADTDFSLLHNARWVEKIVKEWKGKTFETIPLVISGREIHKTDEIAKGIDPSNPHGEAYQYCLANYDMVDEALDCAKRQEVSWGGKSAKERAQLISKVAEQMREKRDQLVGVMMKDGGKTVFETEPEISEAIDFAEYYLRSILEFDQMAELSFTPKGTILITPPWNFPVSIPSGGIIAALVTGNCVIFKPAPEAVLSGWILANLFWEAGIPKEVLQFVNCHDDPVGSQLIQDERINAVILTGGTPTAKLFMKLRPDLNLSAETGGKNALIITGLADRDLAIKDLIQSAFGHSGQKCSAASLAILEAELYDDEAFLGQLKEAVESLHVGTCWDLSSKVVPLILPPGKTLQQGQTSLEQGESWLVEPRPDPNNPHLWSPGVKLGVKEGSFMHQTELFGPVLAIMRAKNLDEALRFANGTDFGLTSGIHTLDDREIDQWIKEIEAGNCYVNRTITGAIVQRQPFGGCKASSFGHGSKAGGPNYLAQFMHIEQRSLPRDKHPLPESINTLTPFIEKLDLTAEELGTWFGSIGNYAYWARQFSHDSDPSKVVGQDNLFRYRPRKKMALRIQKEDRPIDIFRIFAAAGCCHTPLHVTYDSHSCPITIDDTLKRALPLFSFKAEPEEEFNARISWKVFDRVRFISEPTETTRFAAAEAPCYLSCEPLLASGRIELLHYLREIALSLDYHRYGNLGPREGEARSPVL